MDRPVLKSYAQELQKGHDALQHGRCGTSAAVENGIVPPEPYRPADRNEDRASSNCLFAPPEECFLYRGEA